MDKSKLHLLNKEPSIADHFLAELRDVNVQQDRMRFRRNLERLGEVFAYRISTKLDYETKGIQTPLGSCSIPLLKEYPVLATVLRAGLPFYQGFLNYFDKSENSFAGAYRVEGEGNTDVQIHFEYLVAPVLEGKVLILADPMLATGKSLVQTYKGMLRFGCPKQVHIACVIASPEGVSYIQEHIPQAEVWVGALDTCLNEQSYIVPGLGDAGDLAFGRKI